MLTLGKSHWVPSWKILNQHVHCGSLLIKSRNSYGPSVTATKATPWPTCLPLAGAHTFRSEVFGQDQDTLPSALGWPKGWTRLSIYRSIYLPIHYALRYDMIWHDMTWYGRVYIYILYIYTYIYYTYRIELCIDIWTHRHIYVYSGE